MFIKVVNQILKLKFYKSSYTFVSYDGSWTLANGSLNADLYYSDRLQLVEKGNLKLGESNFRSMSSCAATIISLINCIKSPCLFN